jgi:hypothetical protein
MCKLNLFSVLALVVVFGFAVGCDCCDDANSSSTTPTTPTTPTTGTDTDDAGDDDGTSPTLWRIDTEYDAWGRYVDGELVEVKVLRRDDSEPPFSPLYSGASYYARGNTIEGSNAVTYPYHYVRTSAVDTKEEWVLGQPVLTADTVVSIDDFTPAIIPPTLAWSDVGWDIEDGLFSDDSLIDIFASRTGVSAASGTPVTTFSREGFSAPTVNDGAVIDSRNVDLTDGE